VRASSVGSKEDLYLRAVIERAGLKGLAEATRGLPGRGTLKLMTVGNMLRLYLVVALLW
jgi:hypothetical protein